MELSEKKKREYTRRLLQSRMRLLVTNGFFGLLLMHVRFGLDEDIKYKTACTDGERILFHPQYLDMLTDKELDTILMHELLHIVLRHCFRDGDRVPDQFNTACDIVVNSNILLSNNSDLDSICVMGTELMHLTPNKDEGHKYTAEQVYAMLPHSKQIEPVLRPGFGPVPSATGTKELPEKTTEKKEDSRENNSEENDNSSDDHPGNKDRSRENRFGRNGCFKDDHSRWKENDDLRDEWTSRIQSAYEVIRHAYENREAGSIPEGIERLCGQLLKPKVDWKKELHDFIQQEICDYSFAPPDRRFGDSEFFLPDFNEKEDCLLDILFMVDASGSITEQELTLAMSEIRGCIDQFSGKLKGWVSFFDAAVYDPVPIESVQDFEQVMPKGGGGTDFGIIYEYIAKSMYNSLPACLVVLTDGYAEFPSESQILRIPTMWLLNNKDIRPPFGRVIFMESKEFD